VRIDSCIASDCMAVLLSDLAIDELHRSSYFAFATTRAEFHGGPFVIYPRLLLAEIPKPVFVATTSSGINREVTLRVNAPAGGLVIHPQCAAGIAGYRIYQKRVLGAQEPDELRVK